MLVWLTCQADPSFMELIWIPISVLGALMQAVRTAGQKSLNQRLSTMVTTYVRSIFGMPFLLVYLWAVKTGTGEPWPDFNWPFVLHSIGASVSQVAATVFLIQLFTLRNFVVGTTLTKTDVMMTALIGIPLFSEVITGSGWAAIALTVAGVIMISIARAGGKGFFVASESDGVPGLKSTIVGLASGLGFCLSYLFLREASLSLESGGFLMRAGCTVVAVTGLQVAGLGLWLGVREPHGLAAMFPDWRICSIIGFTSALGSICWFTAMTIQNASYVKAVGQVETIFTLIISHLYFREKLNAPEFVGIAVIVAGVLIFVL